MSKSNTTCRVCGTEYFCCGDSKAINSWKAMTCTPECFKEYMRRIEESRRQEPIKTETVVKIKPIKKKNMTEEAVVEKIIDEI